MKVDKLNRSNTKKEIEIVIKNIPMNKSPAPGSFMNKFFKTFQEELPSQLNILKGG